MITKKYQLSQSTIEKLGYYVYFLIDPRDNAIFYVGKGYGNRINQHLLGALDSKTKESEKIARILAIQKSRHEVILVILRHELTQSEAFAVEASVIDVLGKDNLTNIVAGHDSADRGKMSLVDLQIKYEAKEAVIEDLLLLINVNNQYNRNMSSQELYEITRKSWRVDLKRVSKISYACSVYRGIIREVFSIEKWLPSPKSSGRYMFIGKQATSYLRNKYLNTSVSRYWKQGSQNPIKYVDKIIN